MLSFGQEVLVIAVCGAVVASVAVGQKLAVVAGPDVRSSDNLEIACNPPPRPQEELRKLKWAMAKAAGVNPHDFELDHRIPRCLGGSDNPSNLWLQPCNEWVGYRCASGPAAVKDGEEAKRCRLVCDEHKGNLPDDQQFFRTWKDAG